MPRNYGSLRIHVVAMLLSASISSNEVADLRNEAVFERLLAPLMLPAYRLAFGMLRDREEAEDAVQEAAFKAWRHRRSFRAGAQLRPWFFAIVGNQCNLPLCGTMPPTLIFGAL